MVCRCVSMLEVMIFHDSGLKGSLLAAMAAGWLNRSESEGRRWPQRKPGSEAEQRQER